ncbi:hypothetical protein DF268_36085 [Streptomyces sp. V2]|nr:hypothetical protein DF268_36085 [Streptomyces sp. V2]
MDAASGRIERTKVALYACLPGGEFAAQLGSGEEKVLTDLRQYSEARDWVITCELIDRQSIGTALGDRPQWLRLQTLIERGEVQGIVTPMRRMCGLRDLEQTHLDTWLATHNAFVVPLWDRRPTPAP